MIEITVLLVMYIAWLKRNKFETKMIKILTSIYLSGRLFGEIIIVVGLIMVLSCNELNFKDVDVGCSTMYFILCKSIPNYCMVLRLTHSLATFSLKKKMPIYLVPQRAR